MFSENGFQIIQDFASKAEIDFIAGELSKIITSNNKAGSLRNVEALSEAVEQFSHSEKMMTLVKKHIGGTPSLLRAIYFNKTSDKNWLVSWHQDKTTAVTDKIQCSSWTNWSEKDGVLHAQPPSAVFDKMITVRLHIDDADKNNGCLRVIPKSHLLGVQTQKYLISGIKKENQLICEVKSGDVMLMHPLLIHASSKAENPSSRRVLHMEFSSFQLPDNVEWI